VDYDRAIADYDEAIRLDAKIAAAFANLGNAYCAKGDFNDAIMDYDEVKRRCVSDNLARGRKMKLRQLLGV